MADTDIPEEKKEADAKPDVGKYIRTYAKDMATLTGKPLAAPNPVPKAPEKESVVLNEHEQPFFAKPAAAEDRPRESIALPTMQEAGAIVGTSAPAEPVPAALQTEAERVDVLARLRARVGEGAKMSIEAYPPAAPKPIDRLPDLPPPAPVEVAPVFTPPEPELPVNRIPPVAREAAPEPLHTYKTDFVDHVNAKEASPFSVLAAEQDARGSRVAPKKGSRAVPMLVSGVVLLLLGGGGVFAAYLFTSKQHPITLPTASVPSLVAADGHTELKGSGSSLMQALHAAASAPLGQGNITVTYLTESTTTSTGLLSLPQPGGALVRALSLPAPDILLRNIAEDSTVGVIHAGEETAPFFILHVSSYERTFAGMLAWEPSIWDDLETLYPLHAGVVVAAPVATTTPKTASTTATSTPAAPVIHQATPALSFTDAVILNHDARVLKDTNGQTLMLYGYANKGMLIIARDETAFSDLLTRLAATK